METTKVIKSIVEMAPTDFPGDQHEKINELMKGFSGTHVEIWREYVGAWNAVVYRFMACAEHDEKFTASVSKFGTSPPQPERYVQERELFEYFICALSSLEAFHYGLYAINSIFRPKEFNLIHDSKLKKITPVKVKDAIVSAYPKDAISSTIMQLHLDNSFIELNDLRNILIHRAHHGRNLFMGGEDDRKAKWIGGIYIDQETTKSRRAWLSKMLTELMENTYQLTSSLVAVNNKNL